MEDKIVEAVFNQGVPLLILLVVGMFFDRRIWPVFEKLINDISDAACRAADSLEAMVDPDCLLAVRRRNSPAKAKHESETDA